MRKATSGNIQGEEGAVWRAGQAEGSCASVLHGFLPNRLLLPSFCPAWPAFYTSKYGYKMCLRIYLNGDGTGRGTHLSLFFVVMKGPNDPLLRWPFNQKVGPWGPKGGGKRLLGLQKGGEHAWRGSLASQSSLSCPRRLGTLWGFRKGRGQEGPRDLRGYGQASCLPRRSP